MKWNNIAILILCMLLLIPLASATPTLTLTANPATVIADGYNYSKVRANLTDGSSPVSGTYINFSIGSKTLRVKTNSSGIATIVVGPSRSIQTVEVVASTETQTKNITVNFTHADPDSIHLYASPSSVGTRSVSANYTSLIVARVLDKYKNPVKDQQVNFTIYLRKTDGNVSKDFKLTPAGDGSGNVSKITDSEGSASLNFSAGNTSGTAYTTARAGNLSAITTLKILGESYLLVETSVEPEIIDPPAVVNVTISVRGGGDKFEGGVPLDAMLVTDISGSMGEDSLYKFEANGTVPAAKGTGKSKVAGQWNTTFNLNETINVLRFRLNVTTLTWQLISPSGKIYGDIENYGAFIEEGNWIIRIYNSNSNSTNFNLTSYTDKLSAVKVASKTFNALLKPIYDKVGMVSFTEDAISLYKLTDDISYINRTIDSLIPEGRTPTASAIKKATDELSTSKQQNRYLILLSDGLPNIDLSGDYCKSETTKCKPVTEAIDEANKAKSLGIKIYSIGFGVDADKDFMQAIASRDSSCWDNLCYRFAANASELKEIYRDIGKQITDISAKQASLNISLSSGQSYSANGTYVAGSSKQKYITSDNVTIEYNCLGNACEPNTTSPLYWNITTPHAPDNRTIKIGDQWILKFQLNLSNDGMIFNLDKSIIEYLNYTGKNLSINVPGAKVSKNATALKPRGLNVSNVILTVSKDKVRPNGVSKSVLTATVLDEEDNLVPDGTEVVFETNLGSFSRDSILTIYSTETVGGIAAAEIYSQIVGIATIWAKSRAGADIQPDYVLSNTGNVTFINNRIITIS